MSEVPRLDSSCPVVAASQRRDQRRRGYRCGAVAAALAVLLTLTACGGGDYGDVPINIGVVIDDQPAHGVVVQPGGAQRVYMSAGQSLELDASEPVRWTLEVGGTAFTSNGTRVYYAGVDITVTALSASRIALDTSALYLLPADVPITLTAISTYDSAQVARVDVLIGN